MQEMLDIKKETWDLYQKVLPRLDKVYEEVAEVAFYNMAKVLKAFREVKVSEAHLGETTGYGYNDIGRDAVEEVYRIVFKAEKALVRTQFVSGSHTLCKTLFGLLRPNDLLLSITGDLYDTLDEVIGIVDNPSSLKSFGISFDKIDLVNNDFDYDAIRKYLEKKKVKVIQIQRSRGYSLRDSLSIEKVSKVIKVIKSVSPKTIVLIDNCYCEFVSKMEPIEVGADIVVGSLIKNLGAGIARNGGYVVGRSDLVELVAESLTLPGEGSKVGPSLGANRLFLQGIYMAPSVVLSALKTGILASAMLEELGYRVSPKYNEEHNDIVINIYFENEKDLELYCGGIQSGSAIDSYVVPISSELPGYKDKVIMASGSFVQGSSIELSCDGPIRPPYVAYQQGGLTYEAGLVGVLKAIDRIIKDE